ncbi:hypothetical protein SPYCA_2921 [Sphingopyxis sp. FD7]|nr:hypothetical protein SPYCA_2921 [Sphingopyxis sp. FD7]
MTRFGAFLCWLGTPFRAIGNMLRALVNLTRAQLRAIFSLGMLLGIVALSVQNMVLLYWVFAFLKGAAPGSLFGQMALSQQFWNNAIAAGFATIVGLIVFGADWLNAKIRGAEISIGKGDAPENASELSGAAIEPSAASASPPAPDQEIV